MNILKKIPITYLGELHDIVLLNFSVEMEEVLPFIPEGICVRNVQNRAMISMVHVSLRNMRPAFMPSFTHFNYRHIAFRLLVDDAKYNDGVAKGIFFLRSFTDKAPIIWGGSMLTDYRLEKATIKTDPLSLVLGQGKRMLNYRLGDKAPLVKHPELREMVGRLDRAYSIRGQVLMVTQILREKWPLEEVCCMEFQTNFFESARLEGCFRVNETILYQWKPAKKYPSYSCFGFERAGRIDHWPYSLSDISGS